MPLRKSPEKTPAFLAACRMNARKSPGPSTERVKARTRLNGLKNGRYAVDFHAKVAQLGDPRALRVYDLLIGAERKRAVGQSPSEVEAAERRAREAWCAWWRGKDAASRRGGLALSCLIVQPHSPLVKHNGPGC